MSKNLLLKTLLLIVAVSWIFLSLNGLALGAGVDIYNAKCKMCHKETGDGKDFKFTDKEAMSKKTDAQLFDGIKKGKDKMPAFEGKLKDEEIKEIVTYIRQFAK